MMHLNFYTTLLPLHVNNLLNNVMQYKNITILSYWFHIVLLKVQEFDSKSLQSNVQNVFRYICLKLVKFEVVHKAYLNIRTWLALHNKNIEVKKLQKKHLYEAL